MTVAAHGLDDLPPHPVRAVVALGANLGDRFATLQAALDDLAGFEAVRLQAVSPVLETAPVGGPEQPDYLNAVLLVDTTLSPLGLLLTCQQVESAHGRARQVRWGPRTLDVDLISYGGLAAAGPGLTVPHPGAAQRAFVLAPWLAVDPQACLPGLDGEQVSAADLLSRAPDRDGLRPRPDLCLQVPP